MEIKLILLGNCLSLFIYLLSFFTHGFINSIQISTQCKNEKYYDINLFECLKCPENMIPRLDGNFFIKII
jgi:hypothetical protein